MPLPSSTGMACKATGNVPKGGKEPFLCWLQNSQKFFFLDLGNEPWVDFSPNHEHFTWTEMPGCSSNCTSLVKKFWMGFTSPWDMIEYPDCCSQWLNAITFIFSTSEEWLLITLTLVTIYAVVWAHYWGVYSAIVIPSPTAHRVKALWLWWSTESLTGVVILGRLSLSLRLGKRDTGACSVTWLMDMWIAPYDLWYHLHCLAWKLPSAAVEGQCFPVWFMALINNSHQHLCCRVLSLTFSLYLFVIGHVKLLL